MMSQFENIFIIKQFHRVIKNKTFRRIFTLFAVVPEFHYFPFLNVLNPILFRMKSVYKRKHGFQLIKF